MKYSMNKSLAGVMLTLSLVSPLAAQAAIVRVSEGAFIAGSGLITFSEFALGTVNPTYAPADYGGGAGSPTVTFDGWFTGQSLSLTPGTDCPGGVTSACVVGTPTGPLSLDAASPNTFIRTDSDVPTSPVLSGTPSFNGPIAVLFDRDLAGVGLTAGFFNAIGGVAITVFGSDGTVLGSLANTSCGTEFGNPAPCVPGGGIEFLGLATSDGAEAIRGLLFSVVGPEPAGFDIDNLRFGRAGTVTVPEPGTLALLGLGLAGLAATRRRKQ